MGLQGGGRYLDPAHDQRRTDDRSLALCGELCQLVGTALVPLPDNVYRWGAYDIAAHTAYTITFTANVTDDVDFGQTITNAAYVTATNTAFDSDDTVLTIVGIAQAGYGSDPVPGSSTNVGTASVGSTISATLTIGEAGEATLMVTPTLSGVDAADFEFAPATLTVAHNAPGSPAVYPLSCSVEALRYVYLPLVLKNN